MSLEVISLYTKDSEELTYTTGAASMDFVMPDHEDGTALLVTNGDASKSATVTVKAGNSIYAMGDLAVTVDAGDTAIINLKNSGRFKNVSGENSGKILVTLGGTADPTDIGVAVIQL